MEQERDVGPLVVKVKIPVVVCCSGCSETAEIPHLPLVTRAVDTAPTIDRAEIQRALDASPDSLGWRIGALRPRGLGLFLGEQRIEADPMPVAFCPACAKKAQG